MSSKLRSIVFDFDGVILESADVKTEAFCALYAEHGADFVARVRAHHLANLGISRFKKFEWIASNLLGRPLRDGESAALGDRFSSLALEGVLAAPFVDGARHALSALQLPMFVASGTPQQELDLIVERRGLREHFVEVHGTPKEKPEILRDVAQRNGWSMDEVLFVGDGMSDYTAARTAGTAFLARDTPDLHDQWVELGVVRRPDLADLEQVVAAWA